MTLHAPTSTEGTDMTSTEQTSRTERDVSSEVLTEYLLRITRRPATGFCTVRNCFRTNDGTHGAECRYHESRGF